MALTSAERQKRYLAKLKAVPSAEPLAVAVPVIAEPIDFWASGRGAALHILIEDLYDKRQLTTIGRRRLFDWLHPPAA